MKKDFIYLASASPRRRDLLEQIGIAFQIRPADLPEVPLPGERPLDFARRMARDKATTVGQQLTAEGRPVLGADTVVALDQRIFGKPRDQSEAQAMLADLSDATHRVMTAVAVLAQGRIEDRVSISEVRLRATTAAERYAYAATEEPLDKAGGYAVQGLGAVFVEAIKGSYSGVVGLPLAETCALLRRFGLPTWLEGKPFDA